MLAMCERREAVLADVEGGQVSVPLQRELCESGRELVWRAPQAGDRQGDVRRAQGALAEPLQRARSGVDQL
jgi:hypothetical protein